MNHYSRELLIRLIWLALWFITLLGATIFWFDQASSSPNETSIFKPTRKIYQLKMMSEATLDDANKVAIEAKENRGSMPCNERSRAILKIRVMEGYSLNSEGADNLLSQIQQRIDFSLSCSEWIENMQALSKLNLLNRDTVKNKNKSAFFEEALTERVSWNRRLPCVYYQNIQNFSLAVGNPVQCRLENLELSTPAFLTNSGMKKTIDFSKIVLANAPSETLTRINQKELLLTLEPTLQGKLDNLEQCLTHPENCNRIQRLPALKHVSVVILDTKSGDILATLCWSGPCEKFKAYGNLGALLVETPPASTAKLLHAMVLAENGNIDPLMIQRQIKTSGQIDSLVSKRNEWWEKQAICEGEIDQCQHPKKIKSIAKLLNWMDDCPTNDIQCGRLSLLNDSESMILPGFIGKIKITDSNSKNGNMLSWKEYDEIRQGKRKSPGSATYFNTALAVQSSIGAGDSRTSALGLAHLSGQIYRISHGQNLVQPSLIKQLDGSKEGSVPTAALRKAAQNVLIGMHKVLEPAETGWSGPGTVSGAFQREFNRPCTEDCGVWAKTGTVSQKDPGFGGATLFTGIIDLAQLNKWMMKSELDSRGRKLSIGIVAYPKASVNSVHVASELAMHLAAELSVKGDEK